MSMELDIAATESLRDFALARGEIKFNHLCNAALDGEKWAIKRVEWALIRIAELGVQTNGYTSWTDVIRATDTSRPDGAIARSFQI